MFEHVSTTKTTHSTSILRLVAQHLLLQMHSMSITPECYSGILVKNTPSFRKRLGVGYICRFLRFTFSFTPLIPCLLPPRDEREKTERTPTQLPAPKKCFLLRFDHLPSLFSPSSSSTRRSTKTNITHKKCKIRWFYWKKFAK